MPPITADSCRPENFQRHWKNPPQRFQCLETFFPTIGNHTLQGVVYCHFGAFNRLKSSGCVVQIVPVSMELSL